MKKIIKTYRGRTKTIILNNGKTICEYWKTPKRKKIIYYYKEVKGNIGTAEHYYNHQLPKFLRHLIWIDSKINNQGFFISEDCSVDKETRRNLNGDRLIF